MKNLMIAILCVISLPHVIAQTKNWKQIDVPHVTTVELIYQSSHGYLFGEMYQTREIVFSNNEGESWHKTSYNLNFYFNEYGFTEDRNGNIYLFEAWKIFKFDTTYTKFNEFITANNWKINSMAFLNTGDLLTIDDKSLKLYSEKGEFKKSLNWSKRYATILPDPHGQKNYIKYYEGFIENVLIEFDADLTFIGDPKTVYFIDLSQVYRIDDRIFARTHYSDDGGSTWHKFDFLPDDIKCFKGHDNNMYWYTKKDLYISYDQGHTYIKRPFNQDGLTVKYFSASGDGDLVFSNTGYCFPTILISKDAGVNWFSIDSEIGVPIQYGKLIPMKDENLILYGAKCSHLIKKNDSPVWDSFNIEIVDPEIHNPHYDWLRALSDNSLIIKNDRGRYYKSGDLGETWRKMNGLDKSVILYPPVIKKKDILILPNIDKIHFSHDIGENWVTVEIDNQDIINLFYVYGESSHKLTKDLNFYYNTNNQDTLLYYKFATKEEKKIFIPFKYRDFYSAYGSNDLLFLTYEFSDSNIEYSFFRLKDGEDVFSEHHITSYPFELTTYYAWLSIDHNDYLYFNNSKQLLFSDDAGLSWQNITPDFPELLFINDVNVSYDNFIYLSTNGMGILKYELPVSTKTDRYSTEMTVYPNPTTGVFHIQSDNHEANPADLFIFDMFGKIRKKYPFWQGEEIDISHFANGMYFIVIQSSGRLITTKVIKQ
jgi:photosystem II stability/assembly factor-like uncharacterized protein